MYIITWSKVNNADKPLGLLINEGATSMDIINVYILPDLIQHNVFQMYFYWSPDKVWMSKGFICYLIKGHIQRFIHQGTREKKKDIPQQK